MTNCLVLADPNRCIGCYTCMTACVVNHQKVGLQAYPRLLLTHTPTGTMPIQCRHCEDAPCAAVCPVKAITFTGQSVHLNESLCIGCKMCSLACPFGAITPYGTKPPSVEVGDPEKYAYTTEPRWPTPLYGEKGPGEEVHPLLAWRVGQRVVAVKCDQCYFSEQGPECVRVCPTKALHIVDTKTIEQLIKTKRSDAVVDVAAGQ